MFIVLDLNMTKMLIQINPAIYLYKHIFYSNLDVPSSPHMS